MDPIDITSKEEYQDAVALTALHAKDAESALLINDAWKKAIDSFRYRSEPRFFVVMQSAINEGIEDEFFNK